MERLCTSRRCMSNTRVESDDDVWQGNIKGGSVGIGESMEINGLICRRSDSQMLD